MKYYLFLILSAALIALDFTINKVYQHRAGTSPKAGFRFNALLGLFTAIIFWMVNGFRLHFSLYSMVLAMGFSLSVMLYNLCGFQIMKKGNMAIYTLFLMSGGALLPYLCGLLFWEEEVSIYRTVGLVIILAAVLLSNYTKEKTDKKLFLLCCVVFVLNGIVSICSKLNQVETVKPVVRSTEFVVYTGIARFIMAGVCFLLSKKDDSYDRSKGKRGILLLIVCSAAIGGVSFFLQLTGASNLPATVLFPFLTGGTMVFSALAGIVFFKEKPTKQVLLGVALGFTGTLFFL